MDGQRIDVPSGQIATVVTYLEMDAPPEPMPSPAGQWHLTPCPAPDIDWYRSLFRRIGAEWLWFSRLVLPDAELAERRKQAEALGPEAYRPPNRQRPVSQALQAYAALTTSAAHGAVRDVGQLRK